MNFRTFVRWIQVILLQFKSHGPSIIVLILFYILFWNFPQTSDLQLILNQNGLHWVQVPLFFSSLIVIAFLISNVFDFFRGFNTKDIRSSIKSLDKKEEELIRSSYQNVEIDESSKQYVVRMFPKVLGTLLILIVAFSVENAYFEVKNDVIIVPAKLGMGISIFLLLISLNQFLTKKLQGFLRQLKIRDLLSPAIAILCFLTIAYLGLKNQGGSESDIRRLFISLLLLAIMFFNITTSYSRYIVKFKDKIGAVTITAITTGLLALYLFLVFKPDLLTDLTNPLTIINVCIIGLFTIVNLVKLGGKLWKIPLLSILIIVLTIWGFVTASGEGYSHYDISSIKLANTKVKDRPSLKSHFKAWIDERKPIIEQHSDSLPFKAIFVSSEGGGSRAGLWSFLVHSYLYERNPDYFDKHLVSMTGASGGSVGNAMFYNIANKKFFDKGDNTSFKNKDSTWFKYKASHVYEKDFLSTSIASLLGRDLVQSVIGILKFDDRGSMLEKEWEKAYDTIFPNAPVLSEDFLSFQISKDKKFAPLMIINTVNVQKGEYAVISPVTFAENKRTIGVFDDFLLDFDCVMDDLAIKKSTAMSINARFPFVSPVGRVPRVGHFMDSGYYDNIGGTVTRRLEHVFQEVLEDNYDTIFQRKIKSTFLVIANGVDKKFAVDCAERDTLKVNYPPQLIAPLVGVLNATFAQEKEMKKTFGKEFLVESIRMPIIMDTIQRKKAMILESANETLLPILPLGRYLSTTAIQSLENKLISNPEVKDRLDRLVPKKALEE